MSKTISIQDIIQFPDFPRQALNIYNLNQLTLHTVGWGYWTEYLYTCMGGSLGYGEYYQTYECVANGVVIFTTTIMLNRKSKAEALEELFNGYDF